MDKMTYNNDFNHAKEVIDNKSKGFFQTIFYCSNEDLPTLFKDFDFSGKDVLSVAASSDQQFYCLEHGAKSVDLFDINKLTKHYAYLRKWILKFYGVFYPDFDLLTTSKEFMSDLLTNVKCISTDELESYNFWSLILTLDNYDISNLFNRPVTRRSNVIIDTDGLLKKVDGNDFEFTHIDICEDEAVPKKRYDVFYASNILENCGLDNRRLKIAKKNISSLLNPGGKAICSYLFTSDFDLPRKKERELFSDEFDCEQIVANYIPDSDYPVGYVYTKK